MNRLILAASFWSEENMKSILDNLIKWFMTVGKNILIAIVILIIGNKLINGYLSSSVIRLRRQRLSRWWLNSLFH